MKYNKKKHDKLTIIGDGGPISVIISIVNLIHNGCTGFSHGNGSSISIPEEYDFIDMKRTLSKERKHLLKEMKFGYNIPINRQEFLMNLEE